MGAYVRIDDGAPAQAGQKKFCLATISYERPDDLHGFSVQESRLALERAGISTAYLLLVGNCHVDDARNAAVVSFLETDCTDLIFLDADVTWEPEVLRALCEVECVDIVGGVYPYRRAEDDSPEGGGMPVRMLEGAEPDENGLLEVDGLPTGFMRIPRRVLERMVEAAPKATKKGEALPLLFERTVFEGGRMSGDIAFCRKWRAMGGTVHAATELRLGHVVKSVVRDSLAANLRRKLGQTLPRICERIHAGTETPADFEEAARWYDNKWTPSPGELANCVILARNCRGPIIEAGSGLTTVLMAAATTETVFCLEHDPVWAARLRQMAHEAQVKNIAMGHSPLKDGWYDTADLADMPKRFALGVCDGPPRDFGSRSRFLEELGERCSVMWFDDADDPAWREVLRQWAEENGREFAQHTRRSAFIGRALAAQKAA